MRKIRVMCQLAAAMAAAGLVPAALAGPETGEVPGKTAEYAQVVKGGEEGVRGAPPNDLCTGAITVATNGTFVVDQSGATTTAEEPGYSCHNGGAGMQGVCNVWYKFVATSTSIRIQTCATTAVGDSLLALYDVDESNPCNTLVEIACNDDFCGATGFQALIQSFGLVVGQTYYLQVSAWTAADCGPYQVQMQSPIPAVTVPCPAGAIQENETDCLTLNGGCSGQTPGGANPLSSILINLPATVCGTSRLDSVTPTVARDNDYYRFILDQPSSVTLSIQAEFNVQAAILFHTGSTAVCAPFSFWEQTNQVAGTTGTFTVCLPAGDWLVLVRPQAVLPTFTCAQGLKYVLNVTNNGACTDCSLVVPPGATFEGEIASAGDCGGWFVAGADFYNGGCNSVPPVFSTIECGETIYGSTATTGGQRDTDWYKITLAEETEVTWSGTGEQYELVLIVLQLASDIPGSECPILANLGGVIAPVCGSTSATLTLAAGTYAFFAGADFTPAVLCPGDELNPNYRVTLTCGGKKPLDCNENGIDDAEDIAGGTSKDCFDYDAAQTPGGPYKAGGANGIPDECECVADWNRDGIANSTDVGEHINTYFLDQSTLTTIFADVDCNGVSNSADVGEFINTYFAAQANQLPFAGCTI